MANKNLTGSHLEGVDYDTALAVRFIGRAAEFAVIDRIARLDSTQAVQIIGEGGAGKTRFLNEILAQYRRKGSRFVVAKEVIDFYHITNHSIEGLMDAIYRAFQSDVMQLPSYVAARQKLDRHLAEPSSSGGASPYPKLLEDTQNALLADLNSRPNGERLVLVFDTAEKLVYQLTEVEHALGLTQEQLGIWRWLCSAFLPRLDSALVIVAGRKESEPLLSDLSVIPMQVTPITLGSFAEPDALTYFDAVVEAVQDLKPGLAQRIQAWSERDRLEIVSKTGGRPILLALTIDCLAVSRGGLNLSALGVSRPLEEDLTGIIQNIERPSDEVIQAVARTRKGMAAELLARLLDLRTADGDWDVALARERLDGIKDLSFVKFFGDDRVFLHDEMYDLLQRHVLSRLSPAETARVLDVIVSYSRERVEQARSRLEQAREKHDHEAARREGDSFQAALTEHLHYHLRLNAVHGFETYYRYAEEAIQANNMGLDAQLRAELLGFWTERDRDNTLSAVDGLQKSQLIADGAIRWVRRYHAKADYADALALASVIEKKVLIPSEDNLSRLELDVWKLSAQVYTENSPARIEALLEGAIAQLENLEDTWRVSALRAHAYNRLGYLRSMVGRQHAAIKAYNKAVPLWLKVGLDAARATTLNNQAFALSNVGNFDRADRKSKEAIKIQERLGNRSAIGLSQNARALILMQHSDLRDAEDLSKTALRQFRDSGDRRGLALARVALAEIRRRRATEEERLPATKAVKLLKQAIKDAKAAIKGFADIDEQVRQVEALIQLGCAYRDLMYVYRMYPGEQSVEELTDLARRTFNEARRLAAGDSLQTLDAWVREAWTNYYLASYYRRLAQDRNFELADDAISKVNACLDAANGLIDAYYPHYRITRKQGRLARQEEEIVIPALVQIAKIELLNGQMAFNRFENCRVEIAGECPEADIAIREGVGHYTLSMEYDDIASPGFNFRDIRRAKERISERLEKLNASEWQLVYEAVSATEEAYQLPLGKSAMSRFLELNFGLPEELKPVKEDH